MNFADLIFFMDSIGVIDVLLPFILIFTIVFATLQKTGIIGEGKRQFNVIIALVLALSVVVPHVLGTYPFSFDPVDVINNALPQVSLVLVAIVMLLLMIGVFGHKVDFFGTSLAGWIVIFSLAAVVAIFGGELGWFQYPAWLEFLRNEETQALIVSTLIFGAVIFFITKDDSKPKKGLSDIMDNFGKILQKRT